MPSRIEDYALIGDTQTAALVSRTGAIDWLCAPRFDSDACLAGLLGDDRHGTWTFGGAEPLRPVERAYREDTLVLDTTLASGDGAVRVTDFMPPRDEDVNLVRCVEGVRGRVRLVMRFHPRCGYGAVRPWIRIAGTRATALAGADGLTLSCPVPAREEGGGVMAELALGVGERAAFTLTWHPSYRAPAAAPDPWRALDDTVAWWRRWAAGCTTTGPWRDAVVRSAITLKALTYSPSGGMVAAPTTSLPEQLGGTRNWDYRFCWLRDATFTLLALLSAGFTEEAVRWRDWLLRAAAGQPAEIQTLYGPAGERRLTEVELPHLPGYEGARPVRVGNQAATQFQLDVFGEIVDCLHQARRQGLSTDADAWRLQRALLEHVEKVWTRPDEGIWEIRAHRRPFTHSRVMAWVAFDRAVRDARRFGLPGPVERWAEERDRIHADVCAHAFSARKGSFVQFYGAEELDAALLLIPLVGFLPADDPRVRGTVAAVERELLEDGLVRRYRTAPDLDGLPPGEALFLPCSFWLADCQALLGRRAEALALFERLLGLRNDVGLLAEEWDPAARRQAGNFPQAFSHVALVNSARNLQEGGGPRQLRREVPG